MKIDSGNLQQLILKYKNIQNKLIPKIVEAEASTLIDLLDKGFRTQTDPYGLKWPANNDGSRFDKAGTIRDSFSSSYTNNTATIESSLDFASFHQRGTNHLPRRRMIPDNGYGKWEGPIKRTARQVIEDLLEGRDKTYTSKRATRIARRAANRLLARRRAAERAYNRRVKRREDLE